MRAIKALLAVAIVALAVLAGAAAPAQAGNGIGDDFMWCGGTAIEGSGC
ncbi:MAG: hypothetical protein HOV79_23140 [Hamadaea sp.]|nr:hypothetical protein [Hamadaea sp.]